MHSRSFPLVLASQVYPVLLKYRKKNFIYSFYKLPSLCPSPPPLPPPSPPSPSPPPPLPPSHPNGAEDTHSFSAPSTVLGSLQLPAIDVRSAKLSTALRAGSRRALPGHTVLLQIKPNIHSLLVTALGIYFFITTVLSRTSHKRVGVISSSLYFPLSAQHQGVTYFIPLKGMLACFKIICILFRNSHLNMKSAFGS